MELRAVSLDDKYLRDDDRVFMNGPQALMRIALVQKRLDGMAGLNTAGFISGYRGSPLGGFDTALARGGRYLTDHDIAFRPAVNEELAATSIYGTQQVGLFPGARRDGVFAMWYGKGPGVDRAGDALKHGNLAGSAARGGVLVLAGDDHGAKSSTTAHQSEFALQAAFIPTLYPADLQDYADFGSFGFALSRFAGLWAGFKCVADTADASATVAVDFERYAYTTPNDCVLPDDGLNIRIPDTAIAQEQRMVRLRLPAAQAFVRANGLDRVTLDSDRRGLGVVTAGKAYLDVIEALRRLGLNPERCAGMGLRVYKLGMTWPVEPHGMEAFARGHRELLIVEEKRPLIEPQVKDVLYGLAASDRPAVVGKLDDKGRALVPADGELTPVDIASILFDRLAALGLVDDALRRLRDDRLDQAKDCGGRPAADVVRTPYFCSGCPHNTSTRLPEGSVGLAGIGCHVMAAFMPDRPTKWPVQMGGEGANWIGVSPYTDTKHVFQNLGDGTYFHSGSLAIRAAVAAGVSMTYKLLFNDAVAMTGGQPVDGQITVPQLAEQLLNEGVAGVVVVADDVGKYGSRSAFPSGVRLRPRSELDLIQRELRETPGVTALIYDQVCAAEKRRRRKRGTFPKPPKRVFINDLVCEGCGDCGKVSNCVSLQPLETEFGRKRRIDQSSCNADYSCLNGFCPSFVTVHGDVQPKRSGGPNARFEVPSLPDIDPLAAGEGYNIQITGIGGAGVITIGALLGMAAHLEGKRVSVVDMTGLSQKNGAVLSQVKIADRLDAARAARIADGEADLLLACDQIVAGGPEVVKTLRHGRTAGVLNAHSVATAAFTQMPDLDLGADRLQSGLRLLLDVAKTVVCDANQIAETVLGDGIAANAILLGAALQKGLLPVGAAAIERAIELNAVGVNANLKAFALGRWAVADPEAVQDLVRSCRPESATEDIAEDLDEAVRRRAAFLVDYQNQAYARRYTELVGRVRATEQRVAGASDALGWAVARNYFKLLAYKDEYEVARLFTGHAFRERLAAQFDGKLRLRFHLAPPLLARRDPATGRPRKRAFGSWMVPVFRVLRRMRFLRGTAFDPFGHTAERKMERRLIGDYERLVEHVIAGVSEANVAIARELLSVPEGIRGFGSVKLANVDVAKQRERALLDSFEGPSAAAGHRISKPTSSEAA